MNPVPSLLRQVLVIAAVLGACAPASSHVQAQPASTPQVTNSVDLGWIAVIPTDLDQPGYGQGPSRVFSVDDYAAYAARGADEPTVTNLARDLRAAGWLSAYSSQVARPSAADPKQRERAIEPVVSQCPNEACASAVFDLVRRAAIDVRGFVPSVLSTVVGEEAALLRMHATVSQGGPANLVRLLVRDGPFLLDLLIIDWTNAEPPATEALQLAGVLQARLREAVVAASPGLSNAVYRLDPTQLTQDWDGYRRRDGVHLAWYGRSPEQFAATDAYYRDLGVLDLYRYSTTWQGWAQYSVDILRFASSVEAASHFRGLAQKELGTNLGTPNPNPPQLTEVTDVPPLGDESLVVATTVPASELTREPMYVAWIRIDDRIAEVSLIAFDASVAELMPVVEGELQCLQGSDCWEGTAALNPNP